MSKDDNEPNKSAAVADVIESVVGAEAAIAIEPRRTVAVVATLDTKGSEVRFLAERVRLHGFSPLVIDVGVGGSPLFEGDITRGFLAGKAGYELNAISSMTRDESLKIIASETASLLKRMENEGRIQAVLGVGGGTGTWLCNEVVKGLPIGFPKLIVTTMAAHDAAVDVTVMPSVVDIGGLNRILCPILANATAAICGMASRPPLSVDRTAPAIALTMFGVNTKGATVARELLEAQGYEVFVFHSNGAGGRTMEALAEAGTFSAVLDWSTTEVTDELVGGACTAGPNRLESAGRRGVPQIIVPGAVDVINFRGSVPERFAGRPVHMHLPDVPLVRTSVEESRSVGEWIGLKLNKSLGPVKVIIPGGGFSALDISGGIFEDQAANAAFIAGLRTTLRPDIPVQISPYHINSQAFASLVAASMLELINSATRLPTE